MANPATPDGIAPKQLSSRLANMKFMMRGVASNGTYSPQTEPISKRRKIDTSHSTTPISSRAASGSRFERLLQPIHDARSLGTPQAQATEETEWILDVKLPLGKSNVTQSNDESSSEGEEDIWTFNQPSGRQTYGNFKRRKLEVKKAVAVSKVEDDDDLSSASDSYDSDDGPPDRPESFSMRHGNGTKDKRQQYGKRSHAGTESPLRLYSQAQEGKKRKGYDNQESPRKQHKRDDSYQHGKAHKHDKKKPRKTI